MSDAPVSLDPASFRAWLAAHGETEKVGVSGVVDTCPIACWLTERTGSYVEVAPDYGVLMLGCWWPAPLWLCRFVSRVDGGMSAYVGVFAGVALGILDAVLAECEEVECSGA